jgi:hypothetical protein
MEICICGKGGSGKKQGCDMKTMNIFLPDNGDVERLRVLMNLFFPEAYVFCIWDSNRSSKICPVDLHPNCSAASGGNDPCRS